ncbi:hypothetical protein [Streptomyces zingiberis]|uniref:DUF3618 domain-containing protein n=1 Tax=Streptomyces zingiberis TaxID=2053010 RepID=A0ABX1C970_9ACTN|nr:hypothetical protein [Streptomyces zingiberis]NJQ03484.1 hypothetical protein [Streptomyces zingiberis]
MSDASRASHAAAGPGRGSGEKARRAAAGEAGRTADDRATTPTSPGAPGKARPAGAAAWERARDAAGTLRAHPRSEARDLLRRGPAALRDGIGGLVGRAAGAGHRAATSLGRRIATGDGRGGTGGAGPGDAPATGELRTAAQRRPGLLAGAAASAGFAAGSAAGLAAGLAEAARGARRPATAQPGAVLGAAAAAGLVARRLARTAGVVGHGGPAPVPDKPGPVPTSPGAGHPTGPPGESSRPSHARPYGDGAGPR